MKSTIRRLAPLHDVMVCDLTRPQILDAIKEMSKGTRDGDLAIIRAALSYGINAGYLRQQPLRPVDTPSRERKPSDVVVMQPSEIRRVLEGALNFMPDVFPIVLCQTFAGVRLAESCRLHWRDVDLVRNRLIVRASISKTKVGREIILESVVIAWFRHYFELGHPHTGPFTTLSQNTAKQRMSPLHRLLGYRGHRGTAGGWQPGILRDSFASYHFAWFESIDRLIKEMGHTSFSTTRNHYLGAATREAAEEFWGLYPPSSDKVVPMHVASA
jgi:integrase